VKAAEVLRRGLLRPLPWILLLAAVLRWQSSGYFRASDDLDYARAAKELLEGRYRPAGFHELRIGLIAPTALAYAVFGVRHAASLVWPFLSSLLSIVVLHRWASRTSTPSVAAWAALFLAVSTQHALSGAELFPDAPMTFWILLSLDLYLKEREGAGRPWGYAAAGASLYAALATRIEAVKILPAFVALELYFRFRRGTDRRIFWSLASLGALLVLDGVVMARSTGRWNARLDELFPAVESWAADPSAGNMGLGVMLKSLVSPFGAFGILFPVAVVGAVRAWRPSVPLFIGGYLLISALAAAAIFRIADGRHYALVSPFVAWLAAEALGGLPSFRARLAGAGLAVLGILFLHTRLMPDTDAAYRELASVVRSAPGTLDTDLRTEGAMRQYYLQDRTISASPSSSPGVPCWVANNTLMRSIDRDLHVPDGYVGDRGSLVRVIPISYRGLPLFRNVARALFAWKGVADIAGEIQVFRVTP
jgi:hypothetical protein